MQDWEAATIVLASRGKKPPSPHYFHLTLHNSYDSGLQAEMLKRFGLDPKSCPGETVLNRSLPFIKDPIFTVSGQYAQDLTSEVLQSRVLAPHLVDHLGSRLHGINNGAFTKLTVDQEIIEQARIGNYEKLRAWKDRKKEAAFAAITSFKSTNERPLWGKSSLFRTEETPWFIFAGRDDPRQKGYDVASSAITSFLEKGGQASFLFFPIPGDEGLSGLDFLRKLAFRFPESVLVLPAIFKEGFLAALQGSAFGVMPSFYEPFGMANEFYLNGCVAIGRATGGIIQQIVPIRSIHSFTKAVRGRADIWHTRNALPTGFLYREADRFSSNEVYWRAINTTDYQLNGSYPDRIERREQIPLFKAMAKALEDCINDAVSLYISQPERYHQMLVNGIDFILNNFSWEHAAREYYQNLE